MDAQLRRQQLKRYFLTYKLKTPLIMIVVGWLISKVTYPHGLSGLGNIAVAMILVGAGWIAYQVWLHNNAPSDETVDQWLEDDLKDLIRAAHEKTDLLPEHMIGTPLVIRSPILWLTHGIDNTDLVFKKGKDKYVRFGVYNVTIFILAEHLLASYRCDYDFIRKVALNETTREYHYRDIVSVNTEESSTNYTLPDGQRLIKAQSFRLSVASGENIRITIEVHQFKTMTRGEIPSTGAEAAVKVIRNMLRDKKNA
ncbi:MAG: hypothetical protein J0H74_14830 [Chitinophagaceae bacterium]|nr:hypothetical protein [Chitinophagaceae bacterium]